MDTITITHDVETRFYEDDYLDYEAMFDAAVEYAANLNGPYKADSPGWLNADRADFYGCVETFGIRC